MDAGRLERIWLKRCRRGPMDSRASATLIAGSGIEGNTDQGGKRQVTVLSVESWRDAVQELGGVDLDPSARRANLLVSGVELERSRSRILRVGVCRLLIWGETRPCERMEEAAAGLKKALGTAWRGGVYAEVLEGGELAIGDEVCLEKPPGDTDS